VIVLAFFFVAFVFFSGASEVSVTAEMLALIV
jgi:hypothetical protein